MDKKFCKLVRAGQRLIAILFYLLCMSLSEVTEIMNFKEQFKLDLLVF